MVDPLIAQRDAVWSSIKGFAPLRGDGIDGTLFRAALRWKDRGGEVRWETAMPPWTSLAALPQISIRTVSGEDKWAMHVEKKQVHRIEVKLVTIGHDQDEPSRLRTLIRRAIHQVPRKERTALRDASGYATFNCTFPDFEFLTTESQIVRDADSGEERLTLGSACTVTTFVIEVPFEDRPATDNDGVSG